MAIALEERSGTSRNGSTPTQPTQGQQQSQQPTAVPYADPSGPQTSVPKFNELNGRELGLVNAGLMLGQAEQAKANGHPGHARNLARTAANAAGVDFLSRASMDAPSKEEMAHAAQFLTSGQIDKLNKATDFGIPNHGHETAPSQLPKNYEKDVKINNRGIMSHARQQVKGELLQDKADLIEVAHIPTDMAKFGIAAIKDAFSWAKDKVTNWHSNSVGKAIDKQIAGGNLSQDTMDQLQSVKADLANAKNNDQLSNRAQVSADINTRYAVNSAKADQARGAGR